MGDSFDDFLAIFTRSGRPPQRLNATIIRNSDEEPVGRISLAPEHQEPDLGIWIYNPHRFKGYGSEAVHLAVDYIFENFALDYIVAGIYAHNLPSMRLFARAGFRRWPELDEVEDDALVTERLLSWDSE